MIIFDTNVISELLKDDCAPPVNRWLTTIAAQDMATTSVNAVELRGGLVAMQDGKRKAALHAAVEKTLAHVFGQRIYPYDAESSRHHAIIIANMRPRGEGISFADGMIAAIARQHGCAIATRDVGPFRQAGVEVINPWHHETS